VSRQYVYKLFRLWREQEDALIDLQVEKESLNTNQITQRRMHNVISKN